MNCTRRRSLKIVRWVTVIACAAMSVSMACAQTYPTRPIRIVVPFTPSGAVDTMARMVGQKLSEQMGQPVVVDNRPGASANLGAELVAKASPDGYTVLMGANGLATNMTLFPNLPFNALRDLAPIARVGYAPLVLVCATSFPAKSLKELVAMAKAQPGQLTHASPGNGSSVHLAGEMFRLAVQIDVLHVPYKGGAPALVDLLGGRISFMFYNPPSALPHIRSQRLRALAASSVRRVALLPDVPTISESGAPGFEATVWWGLVAPAKTPKEVIAKLNAQTVKALANPAFKEKLAELGVVTDPSTAEEFGQFLQVEVDKWAKVIKTSGIKVD